MKFSGVLKLVGAATLAVGLLPHKVEMNDETGEMEIDALLWNVKRDCEGQYDLNLLPKFRSRKDEYDDYDDDEFADLFQDEPDMSCDFTDDEDPAGHTMDNLEKFSGVEMQYNDEPVTDTPINDVLDNISYEKTEVEDMVQEPQEDLPQEPKE